MQPEDAFVCPLPFESPPNLNVVRLYALLYAAFLGFVSHPQPLGAFTPNECRITRFKEARAANFFLSEGLLGPNFMCISLQVPAQTPIDTQLSLYFTLSPSRVGERQQRTKCDIRPLDRSVMRHHSLLLPVYAPHRV
jgi:hypothetical protein